MARANCVLEGKNVMLDMQKAGQPTEPWASLEQGRMTGHRKSRTKKKTQERPHSIQCRLQNIKGSAGPLLFGLEKQAKYAGTWVFCNTAARPSNQERPIVSR